MNIGIIGAGRMAGALGVNLAKAGHQLFNCCHFHVWRMSPPVFDGRRLAVPYGGDDSVAKACVRALSEQMGCRPLDLGRLGKALHIEYLAAIVIGLPFDGADPCAVFNLHVRRRITARDVSICQPQTRRASKHAGVESADRLPTLRPSEGGRGAPFVLQRDPSRPADDSRIARGTRDRWARHHEWSPGAAAETRLPRVARRSSTAA